MEPGELERRIAALAALNEPVRQSLYFYVVNQQRDVSRDEAALAVGVTRTLAGFHLDRLAEEGLLETSFRRLSGRSGPGAGRPAKLYRRSGRQLEVSLPQRSYELAARILAGAIEANGAGETANALTETARTMGEGIGADSKARAGSRAGRKRLVASTVEALSALGYEPELSSGEIRLRNCPFHALVGDYRELVCGMNLALVGGIVEGLELPGATAVLDPQSGMCCVALRFGEQRAQRSSKLQR
ncbi:MAG: helix-turn-helix transcriptional regulator [Candidatus Methylomirabilaceae bacterium]